MRSSVQLEGDVFLIFKVFSTSFYLLLLRWIGAVDIANLFIMPKTMQLEENSKNAVRGPRRSEPSPMSSDVVLGVSDEDQIQWKAGSQEVVILATMSVLSIVIAVCLDSPNYSCLYPNNLTAIISSWMPRSLFPPSL